MTGEYDNKEEANSPNTVSSCSTSSQKYRQIITNGDKKYSPPPPGVCFLAGFDLGFDLSVCYMRGEILVIKGM